MVSPVMMMEHRWHARLGPHMMPAVVGVFTVLGLAVVPALGIGACAALNGIVSRSLPLREMIRRFSLALVPVGIGMWAAHLLYHFSTGWGSALSSVERAMGGAIAAPIMPTVPNWLIPTQVLLLDLGVLLTLYVLWRLSIQYSGQVKRALAVVGPWAALACVLYGTGVWILFQPMQMRGMGM
jgi:hypothetical protein